MNKKRLGITILMVLLIMIFANIYACYDNEGRKHNEFFAANKQYIDSVYEGLKSAKKGDLLEMRDGNIWVITKFSNFLKRGIIIEKMNNKRIDRFLSDKELCYNIIRIIKTEDSDYPEKAKQFLLEK